MAWEPYAAGAVLVLRLCLLGSCRQPQSLGLSATTPILMKEGKLAYLPPTHSFDQPQDWTHREAVVEVKLPANTLVASLKVKDWQGRSQSTRWAAGQPTEQNIDYDAQSGLLRLHLRPTRAEVDEQGHTDVVYELAPVPGKLPPPEHQQLFGELWTGRRLRAGMAVPLTFQEYERRRQQWRELCGREWVQGCAYPEPSRPVPWQVLLLLPLPALLWLWRRKRQAEAAPRQGSTTT